MSDNIYTYDKYGLKVETHSYNEDGSLNVRWVHEYDDLGHLEKEFQYFPNGDTHESKKPADDKTINVYCQYDQHRSEEHTSELQSLMRISYAVFCLKQKKNTHITSKTIQ